MGCQKLEDFNLFRSEVEPAAIEPDVIIIDVYFKIAMLYDLCRFFFQHSEAPEDSLDPCHDLTSAEGFNDIVIRSELETEHAVNLLGTRSKHYDGDVADLPDLLTDIHAVLFGHHDIKNDDIGFFTVEFGNCLLTVVCGNIIKPVVFEVSAERFMDDMLIITDENQLFCSHYLHLQSFLYQIILPAGYFCNSRIGLDT